LSEPAPVKKSQAMMSLFFGGLLPVIAFALIEEYYGPVWGTVAGMIFGAGEIIFEKIRYKKVSAVTWIGNTMILILGAISVISQEGIWFKLQPALFEGFFAVFLWVSWFSKKPFLLLMAEKQNPHLPDVAKPFLSAVTFRLGIFFALQAALASYAAFYWTTAQWAWLKGAGLIISFLIYLALEVLWKRRSFQKRRGPPDDGSPPS
jgi:intracellular septation protein